MSEPQALKASVLLPCTPSARDFLCLQTNYRLSRIKGNCRQDCWKALQDPSNSKQLSVIRRSSVEGRMNEQRKIHKGPTRTRTMAEHSNDTTKSQTDNTLISIDSGRKTPLREKDTTPKPPIRAEYAARSYLPTTYLHPPLQTIVYLEEKLRSMLAW